MALLLDTLDDHTLTARLRKLAGDERNLLVDFLFHLAELDGRRSYVRDGYSSLWDLGPSPSSRLQPPLDIRSFARRRGGRGTPAPGSGGKEPAAED